MNKVTGMQNKNKWSSEDIKKTGKSGFFYDINDPVVGVVTVGPVYPEPFQLLLYGNYSGRLLFF